MLPARDSARRGVVLGLVVGKTLPGDGRARVLRLTAKGRELTKLIQEISADIERRWELELGAATTNQLRVGLERLDTLGSPVVGQRREV